ncbi:uncharacterized protein LOC131674517 [Phymastichus coffea]|uniref:uncharacterized protein LOC131674517 n=1 Tax=Phymastichus coffea TaxID=108790 RepID=UPI00273B4FA4|nr:uncharacterized protein LOC131674517 [Phymastichus coffea]
MADVTVIKEKKVGFIGGGNMAQAIGFGLVKKGVLKSQNIWVSCRTEQSLSIWKSFGIHTTLKNHEVIKNCDIIFLSIKPHILDEALATCKNSIYKFEGKLYVSVIVGVSLDALDSKLQSIDSAPRIIRSMPNTPMMVAEGITVYCSLRTTEEDEFIISTLFSQLGICEKIGEGFITSAGGLSGCGPAYAYLIIEGLADGAVRKGVPRASALRFAAQVLIGAGKMVLETGKHPGQLKDEVTSPNGSTICGIHELEKGGVRASMMNAVEAAVKRSDEIADIMNKK